MFKNQCKLIHDKIKKIRTAIGYKQEYVAMRLGLSQTGYSKIETGETGLTLERAFAIAAVFEMSLIELLEWQEPELSVVRD
jgi:transcriptional regulator with XRE-family HTH domain